MTLFRMGQLDPWVEWMAAALERSSEAAGELLARSEALLAEWRVRLVRVREDAVAHRVIDLLAEQPVCRPPPSPTASAFHSVPASPPWSRLARHGIVERYRPEAIGPGRPTRYFMASELLARVGVARSLTASCAAPPSARAVAPLLGTRTDVTVARAAPCRRTPARTPRSWPGPPPP